MLTNELSNMQQKKEKMEQDKALIETNLDGTTKNAYSDNIIFGKIFMAIDNLYSRCNEVNQAIKQQTKKTTETKTVQKKDQKEKTEGGQA